MLFQKSTIGFQFNQFVGTQLSRVYTFICLCVYKVLNQNYETSRFLSISDFRFPIAIGIGIGTYLPKNWLPRIHEKNSLSQIHMSYS